jgi:hypothetical protein
MLGALALLVTVRVAGLLVMLPAALETMTWKADPLSAIVVAGVT